MTTLAPPLAMRAPLALLATALGLLAARPIVMRRHREAAA